MVHEAVDEAVDGRRGGTGATGGVQSVEAAPAEVTLRIDGMHCGSCIRRVTQAIAQAGPFAVKEVRLGAARFGVTAGGSAPAEEAAIAALAKAGFAARVEA